MGNFTAEKEVASRGTLGSADSGPLLVRTGLYYWAGREKAITVQLFPLKGYANAHIRVVRLLTSPCPADVNISSEATSRDTGVIRIPPTAVGEAGCRRGLSIRRHREDLV